MTITILVFFYKILKHGGRGSGTLKSFCFVLKLNIFSFLYQCKIILKLLELAMLVQAILILDKQNNLDFKAKSVKI